VAGDAAQLDLASSVAPIVPFHRPKDVRLAILSRAAFMLIRPAALPQRDRADGKWGGSPWRTALHSACCWSRTAVCLTIRARHQSIARPAARAVETVKLEVASSASLEYLPERASCFRMLHCHRP